MGARWVDPSLARWLSPDSIVPDPSDPQSLNRFSYVRGNPLRFVDPTGHFEDAEIQEATGLDDEAFAEWWASLPQELINMLHDAQWASILSFDEPILGETVHFELLFGRDRQTNKMAFFNLTDGKKMNFWEGISHSRTALEETGVRAEVISFDSARHPLKQQTRFFQGDDVFLAFDDEFYRGYVAGMKCAVGVGITLAGLFVTKGKPTLPSAVTTLAGVGWTALTCDLSESNNPIPYIWEGQAENWRGFPDTSNSW